MWFEDATSFETPEFEAAIADTANFLDPDRSQGFSVDELEIVSRAHFVTCGVKKSKVRRCRFMSRSKLTMPAKDCNSGNRGVTPKETS